MKWENKKLNELLTIMCRNYHDLKNRDSEFEVSRKRKFLEIENCDECSPKLIRSNVSRVHVRIHPSDTTLVGNLISTYIIHQIHSKIYVQFKFYRLSKMDINGGNMDKKSPGIILLLELTISAPWPQLALLRKRCITISEMLH